MAIETNCDLSTITIPYYISEKGDQGDPGAPGADGSSGATVLHNDIVRSSAVDVGGPLGFIGAKTYDITMANMATGDRLKIEVIGLLKLIDFTSLAESQIQIYYGGALIGAYPYSYGDAQRFKINTTIDFISIVNPTAANITANTQTLEILDINGYFVPNIFYGSTSSTQVYASTKALELKYTINGVAVDANNYIHIDKFVVEHYKKV